MSRRLPDDPVRADSEDPALVLLNRARRTILGKLAATPPQDVGRVELYHRQLQDIQAERHRILRKFYTTHGL